MSRVNEHGQPIGEPVDWTPRVAPGPVVLAGRYVGVAPVGVEDSEALHASLAGPDDAPLWTYRTVGPPESSEGMAALVRTWVSHPADVTFALTPLGAAGPQGLATLMRADPAQGTVEVGSIILARTLQRTRAATEAMYLLARHAFDDLGYRRYEWKCDSLNEPSRGAATRLGFTYEGRFRQAVVYRGRNRDTDWFSISDGEWPGIRAALEAWLDPGNFDADGRQRTRLACPARSA